MREVGQNEFGALPAESHPFQVGVGTNEELIEQTELLEQLLGGRMDRVAAEVADEVPVLLDDGDIHTVSQQQQRRHEPGRGRPRGAASARERLLEAAHRHFDAGDLVDISSRELAKEVGVSHTLVNYHFGSRDGLIAATVSLRAAPHHVIAAARAPDGRLDLERLVHGLIALWEHPEHGRLLVRFAQQLVADAPHAPALLSYLQHTVIDTLAAEFGQERARRMTTALVGVVIARYVLRLHAMTALTTEQAAIHLLSMMR